MTGVIPNSQQPHDIWRIEHPMSAMARKKIEYHASGSAVYGLGFLGAAAYYFSTATTFVMGLIGFLKALVWPAFLVYEALKQLGS